MSTSSKEITGWLVGRLPEEWFTGPPEVIVDRDEITIIGTLPVPETGDDADPDAAAEGRIRRFREETREKRIKIHNEARRRYRRHVAWGVKLGDRQEIFTNVAAPAMTRLRQPERLILDTLVDAGVARSRAEALNWCVKLVGRHENEWLQSLRDALNTVDEVRRTGPSSEE